MVNKRELKIIMDNLWQQYATAEHIIGTLKNIGLEVEPGSVDNDGTETPFSKLYAIQDMVGKTLKSLLGIEDNFLSDFLSDLDQHLADWYSEYPKPGPFPDDLYEKFFRLFNAYGGKIRSSESMEIFEGCLIGAARKVKGYLWTGADHTYIIPHNAGVIYDEKTRKLTAYAEEIDKDTIR